MNQDQPTIEQLSLLLATDEPQAVERLHSLLASLPPDEAGNLLDEVLYDHPIAPKRGQRDGVGIGILILVLALPVLPILLWVFAIILYSLFPFVIVAIPAGIYYLIVGGPKQARIRRQTIGLRAAWILASMNDERAIEHLAMAWREWHHGKLPPSPPMGIHEIEAELIRIMERCRGPMAGASNEALHDLLTEALSEIRRQQRNGGDIREELADLILTTMRFLALNTPIDMAAFNLIEDFANLPQGDPSGNAAVVREAAYALEKRWRGTPESAAQPVIQGRT